MIYLAWLGALLIGISLGLLGSGGSILTVPVLVYVIGEPDKIAIAESLGIVGAISLIGAIPYAFQKTIHWRSVVLFGIPGMVGTYLGAWISKFLPGSAQLALFAVVMLVAAMMMLRRQKIPTVEHTRDWWKVALEGISVGIITGLVGVGGGFLIVPALVLLGGLSMHLAIGTSLIIIALKSFTGFLKYLDVLSGSGHSIDWKLILLFTIIGIVGSFAGGRMARSISQTALRTGFAIFLILMGVFILWNNVSTMMGHA